MENADWWVWEVGKKAVMGVAAIDNARLSGAATKPSGSALRRKDQHGLEIKMPHVANPFEALVINIFCDDYPSTIRKKEFLVLYGDGCTTYQYLD
ncbi:hypothetical protein [Photobacterium sp.]|uniref:hypothetical protein n=1 Tax=Photobacterium sp. TaxID=660 RepID=UPI00299D6AF3|nr:hypothetical protein [Photobacterium sp.]MDX1304549.1 hypothetical protein [Photobacterium sp.]